MTGAEQVVVLVVSIVECGGVVVVEGRGVIDVEGRGVVDVEVRGIVPPDNHAVVGEGLVTGAGAIPVTLLFLEKFK